MTPTIDLTTKTPKELAEWIESAQGRPGYQFLAKIEFQRRLIKEQHELNNESVRLAAKYAGTWALIGAIAGAIVGACVTALIAAILSGYLSK